MSETGPAWTPGPRRIVKFDDAQTVVIASGATIATFTGPDKAANAHLDVAAPDLYGALALYVEHFGDPLKVARPALAKARGEA